MDDDFLGGGEAEQMPQQQDSELMQQPENGLGGEGEDYGDFGGFAGEMPLGDDTFAAPVVDGDGLVEQVPEMNGAFMDGDAFPEPAAPPAAPEIEDPRVQWRKKNQAELAQKDKEEMAQRMALKEQGAEHLKKVREMREKRLSARKEENRKNNDRKPEAGSSYEGSTWQKVNALVNFTSGTHTKDVVRMKSSLTQLNSAAA